MLAVESLSDLSLKKKVWWFLSWFYQNVILQFQTDVAPVHPVFSYFWWSSSFHLVFVWRNGASETCPYFTKSRRICRSWIKFQEQAPALVFVVLHLVIFLTLRPEIFSGVPPASSLLMSFSSWLVLFCFRVGFNLELINSCKLAQSYCFDTRSWSASNLLTFLRLPSCGTGGGANILISSLKNLCSKNARGLSPFLALPPFHIFLSLCNSRTTACRWATTVWTRRKKPNGPAAAIPWEYEQALTITKEMHVLLEELYNSGL